MKQPKESDIAALTAKLEQIAPHVSRSNDPEWSHPPAVKVINCVLSLRTSYEKVVLPRLETFMSFHPDTRQVAELANLMAGYPTPHAFVKQEFDYDSERKARILQAVVKFVCQVVQKAPDVPEEAALKKWAIQAMPQDYLTLNIKGFALASFQYLRKLFGAETVIPTVHTRGFISEVLGRNVSDLTALVLLEAASERAGLSTRDVDSYIWRRRARGHIHGINA